MKEKGDVGRWWSYDRAATNLRRPSGRQAARDKVERFFPYCCADYTKISKSK